MKKQSKKEMILNGDIYSILMTLSIPIMVNNLIQTLYNLVDAIWVSKLGSVQFASTSFVWPVNFLFISIGFGISIAGTSILSQLIGADKNEEANEYANQIMVIAVIISIIFAIIGYKITPLVIRLMGATGDLEKYSNIYLKITFLDMPFMFMFFVFNAIMVAQGNTLTPTILSGISAVLNAVLDPIFIFNLDMGIAGAAIATLVSRAILVVLGIIVLIRTPMMIKPSIKGFKFDNKKVKKIISVALPSSVGQSGSALGFIVLNGFIASYGTSTMAAYGMVNRITALVMQPPMGVGAALTSIVGQNIGANQLDRAKEAFKKALKITVTMGIIGCIIMLWKDKQIINIFMRSKDDMEAIKQGTSYLRYSALFTPLMGVFSVLKALFEGSGHTKYSMSMEIGRLWFIRLPMILLFKHFTDIGPTGIWISMSISNLIICIYGYLIYRTNTWQGKIVQNESKNI